MTFKEILESVIRTREIARQNKDWKKADDMKKILERMGYEVRDTEDGLLLVEIDNHRIV